MTYNMFGNDQNRTKKFEGDYLIDWPIIELEFLSKEYILYEF